MLNVHHAGENTRRLDEKLCGGVGIGDELYELDSHEGDLRHQVIEVEGLLKCFLLFKGQGFGIEPMFPGILVAGLAAAPAARWYWSLCHSRLRLDMAVLGLQGSHMLMIEDMRLHGEGEGGGGLLRRGATRWRQRWEGVGMRDSGLRL